jgi:anti-sigma regulatory factor (Ser/Thr protein kinase)
MDLNRSYGIVKELTMNERQILTFVSKGVPQLTKVTAATLDISRQSVNKIINNLISMNYIEAIGKTRATTYVLGTNRAYYDRYKLDADKKLDEHLIWEDFKYVFDTLPANVHEICFYGFTEIVNNAIDHSDGKMLHVCASLYDGMVDLMVHDNGEGIFKRIARLRGLNNEKESILELSKGKLTTDSDNHTGEGIYFTSRVFDNFYIYSAGHIFDHDKNRDIDYLLEHNHDVEGTIVEMQISATSKTSQQEVFNAFAPADEFSFSKTVVPVRLAIQGKENLVSRSQAKRVLARLDKFKTVILDFEGVETIGQAFADEIFRIFVRNYPEISIIHANANENVLRWITRAEKNM